MGSMDELRSPSLPTSPAAPVIVFPSPSMLSVLQLLGTIRCPKKPRAAQPTELDGLVHRRGGRGLGGGAPHDPGWPALVFGARHPDSPDAPGRVSASAAPD